MGVINMDPQSFQQLKNINYLLSKTSGFVGDLTSSTENIGSQVSKINDSLIKLNQDFVSYQSSITNQPWFQFVIGSIVTFIAAYLYGYIKDKKDDKKATKRHLYYLQRLIVDQINLLIDTRCTIVKFIDERIAALLANVDRNPGPAYSVDNFFFPLFSVRPLPDDVNMRTSGSGFIDNKIAKAYALSNDLPHMIEDIRLQLSVTLELNQKIALGKMNSAEVQKEQYKRNIQAFEKMIRDEILGINIPLYLEKLAELHVVLREKTTRRPIVWKIKFDPKWKFYSSRSLYMKARGDIMETMEKYFKSATSKQLEEIAATGL